MLFESTELLLGVIQGCVKSNIVKSEYFGKFDDRTFLGKESLDCCFEVCEFGLEVIVGGFFSEENFLKVFERRLKRLVLSMEFGDSGLEGWDSRQLEFIPSEFGF